MFISPDRYRDEDGEKRLYMHKEMRFHDRDREGEGKCEREGENCRRGSMDCWKENDEEWEEKMGKDCCKEENEEGRNCSKSDDDDSKIEKKDSVIEKKTLKK